MMESQNANGVSAPLDIQKAIDSICNTFDARLLRGEEPRIEEALAECAEECRPHLFRELLKMERESRQKRADEDYRRRFPEYFTGLNGGVPNENSAIAEPAPGDTTPYTGASINRINPLPAIPGYEDLRELDHGGMGIVYRARQVELCRDVALTMMLAGPYALPEERQRFRFEAEAVARLQHPNIVEIFDFGDHEGRPFFTMKFVEGGNLASHREQYRQDPKKAARLVSTIGLAVQHAHDRGVLHRDLKPKNILLDAEGRPYIADFGLAKQIGSDGGLTQSGAAVGTLQYMAPEQALGERGLTVMADVYALGAILYDLLTGSPPVKGKTVQEVISFWKEGSAVSRPRLLNPTSPIDLEAICLKCLERDPAKRYASAAALAEDLDRFDNGLPVLAHPPGAWDWFVQSMRTRPQPYPDYTITAPFWAGGLVFAQHTTNFALVETSQPVWILWIVMLAGWLGMGLALWMLLLRRFRELPVTERHSMMISVGHVSAQIVLFLAVVPLSLHGASREILPLYPPLIVVSGLCFIILGSTNWGRLFPIGLVMMLLALVPVARPETGPLLFAIVVPLALLWWALAKWRYFVRVRKTPEITPPAAIDGNSTVRHSKPR
jgi:serine/threonine-protein kinase